MENRPTLVFIVVLALIAILLGINFFTTPFLKYFENFNQAKTPVGNQGADEESSAESIDGVVGEALLVRLSSEQKVAQLIAYPVNSEVLIEVETDNLATAAAQLAVQKRTETLENLKEFQPGLITIFGQKISADEAQGLIEAIDSTFSQAELPPLYAVDHEGGAVQRLSGDGFTRLDSWQQLCGADEAKRQQQLNQSAQELQALGINIVYAPVLDIDGSVLGSRSCNNYEDLKTAAQNFIEAFGSHQIMSVIKHFPGIGSTTSDLHHQNQAIQLSAEDTQIFSDILDLYPNIGVMTAHIKLTNLLDGWPCSLSSQCLAAFPDHYPNVLIFTDALDMGALDELFSGETADPTPSKLAQISIKAIEAGNNILVFGKDVQATELEQVQLALIAKYQTDELFQRQVDQSLTKLLTIKKFNL